MQRLHPLPIQNQHQPFNLQLTTARRCSSLTIGARSVLVNFWATDCGGCVLEIPSFIELEKAYKDRGFTAVGVSMDISYEGLKDANEAWGRVRPFIAKHGVNYPIAMGNDEISKAYELNAFPATYLIDKSGRVAVAYVGVLINKENVATNIASLLSNGKAIGVMSDCPCPSHRRSVSVRLAKSGKQRFSTI